MRFIVATPVFDAQAVAESVVDPVAALVTLVEVVEAMEANHYK